MMSKTLSVLGIALSAFGTVSTLWSVLTFSRKQADFLRTAQAHDDGTFFELQMKQKRQTILGIILIAVGSSLQILGIFLP